MCAKLRNVIITYGGVPIAPRTNLDNIADPETGEPTEVGGGGGGGGGTGGTVTSVKYASSAGLTSNVTDALKAALINSAVAAVPTVTSVASAGLTSSVTDDLKTALINSAVAAVPTVTSVASAGTAGDLDATAKTNIINSATGSLDVYKAGMIASAVNQVSQNGYAASAGIAAYGGLWKLTKDNNNIVIASGNYWVGNIFSSFAQSSVASANGNVYFYIYYNNGSYTSGIVIAQNSNTLPAYATGQAGYYTILGNVTEQGITQYQYGTFHIDGRVV